MFLDEIVEDFRCAGVNVTSAHLRKIGQAQHGGLKSRGGKARFSNALLASYPRFIKGPGGKWGCFATVLADYWTELRRENIAPIIPFRARRVV